ncbi:MAG TPA: BMP family ABC transporter substrate-binding protein [Symbiobacteriaceae bacterium]|nr:BMP family ABC transporter substrate-binding protein [Symbiobacteriaceae bacterium]
MKKLTAAALALALTAALVAGCSTKPTESAPEAGTTAPKGTEPLKVAWVYIGPPGDAGWTYEHDQGRKQVEKELGAKVQTSFVENVPEGADAERVFEELAQKGNKVIFGTSFGYMDSMVAVAQRHPEVTFLHATGFKTEKNLGTYQGRNHQGFYLSGIAAGYQLQSTPSNTVGMVAAFPIPEVIRAINAFALGMQSVNPTAKVKVVWTNTWFDPNKEKDAANALLAAGVDGLAMYQDSPATLQAAQEKGKFAIGNDSDARVHAPKAFLTAPVFNWGPYYVKTIKSVLDGTWKSEQYWGGMNDQIVTVAPLADFAKAEAKTKVAEVKKQFEANSLEVFTGPIKDQSGAERVKAGAKLADGDQLSMDWFVAGVEGSPK